jgi:putative ATPase
MSSQPLAAQIRPKNLDEFIGQEHLVGPNKPLRVAIASHQIFSMIFWGPPGVGKTTLARIIAKEAQAELHELSAVSAGKDDIRKIIGSDARGSRNGGTPSLIKKILFLDEIHRFNKAQQDYLLPFVESGALTLIGATTENPSFEIIAPLLSRCRVFTLKELSEDDISQIIDQAIKKLAPLSPPQRLGSKGDLEGLKKTKILKNVSPAVVITKAGREWLINMANGDARQCLTMIDNAYTLYGDLTLDSLKNALQNSFLRFDKKGEEHYNTISAFIKSMRASNPNAALYYLARMIEAGEDPKFIARRMVVFASEDIGIANSSALILANQVFEAVTKIGYPECAINLAHGVVYLSSSLKNRSAYDGLRAAQADVRQFGNLPIPMSLRNAPTKLMEKEGYLPADASHQAMQAGGKGYEMYTKDDLLPDKLKGKKYLKKS